MASRVEIDSKLVNAAKRAGGHPTNKEAVNAALEEYVQRRGQIQILELRGKIDYFPDYDHKKLRHRR
jgi:Arc/MetJ family transcription regulator